MIDFCGSTAEPRKSREHRGNTGNRLFLGIARKGRGSDVRNNEFD